MPRYKLTVEYDGSCFSGWQRQRNQISVQEALQQAVKTLFNEDVLVEGAGRTDTGVHALGQVAHMDLAAPLPPYRVRDGLNSHLRTRGVSILCVKNVPDDFHARFSAIGREYEYHIINRRAPVILEAHRAWHVIPDLDVEKMQRAARHFVGTYDFSSFRTAACQAASPIRTLDLFEIKSRDIPFGKHIIAHIASRSFLHNQVRIMMGTLKLVGEGRLEPDAIPSILEARDRTASGPTAPSQGLYLKNISYKEGL
ncbi:MAG: tRNA pseudouridine(38-40) synthase TruA [Alphaproteobacteria bacterium]|nr:tRNA pseudouridine(38-40) synthase TruA [Alphaproteobacteria bacterium]